LEQRTKELEPDGQEGFAEMALPIQERRIGRGLQEGLEEVVDLLLECRL
jgi:hypothetical protein